MGSHWMLERGLWHLWRRCQLVFLVGGVVTHGVAAAQGPPAIPPLASAAAPLVLQEVTVIDVATGRRVPRQNVIIVGRRIQTIGPVTAVPVPTGAQVVEARGKYLIPGLWDMHAHPMRLTSVFYPLFLATGVTGFRDAGSMVPLDTLRLWRDEIGAGTRVGPPRQVLSGQSIIEEATCRRTAALHTTCVTAGDTADARHLVDSLHAAGADMIKTYKLSDTMYFAVAAAARRAHLPFGGHTSMAATRAADSGAGLIDHTSINKELRAHCLYGRTASVEACRPIAEHLARRNAWWVPTWTFFPVAGRERTAAAYIATKAFLRQFWAGAAPVSHLREALHHALRGEDLPSEPSPFVFHRPRPSGGTTPDTAGYMHVVRHAGLPIVAGTDANKLELVPGGLSLHVELATYVAEGLTPLEALQTATLNPTKFLHGTDSLGTVAPGKLADLVLLEADPLADITNTLAIHAVVADGRYFDRAALDELLAVARAQAKEVP